MWGIIWCIMHGSMWILWGLLRLTQGILMQKRFICQNTYPAIYLKKNYLNIFIQDIKHNSARLLYVVLLYNKLCGCIKILFLIHSFKTIMGGSIFKVRWQTVSWNGTLVHKWISECFNIWLRYDNIHIISHFLSLSESLPKYLYFYHL